MSGFSFFLPATDMAWRVSWWFRCCDLCSWKINWGNWYGGASTSSPMEPSRCHIVFGSCQVKWLLGVLQMDLKKIVYIFFFFAAFVAATKCTKTCAPLATQWSTLRTVIWLVWATPKSKQRLKLRSKWFVAESQHGSSSFNHVVLFCRSETAPMTRVTTLTGRASCRITSRAHTLMRRQHVQRTMAPIHPTWATLFRLAKTARTTSLPCWLATAMHPPVSLYVKDSITIPTSRVVLLQWLKRCTMG